jgi:hypothetical protein
MDHIRVLICRVDDTDQMTEVAAFDMAGIAPQMLAAEQTLNSLEASTLRTGNAIMQTLFQAQWALDAEQARPPDGVAWADWTRVLAARREVGNRTAAELRQLGPTLAPGEVLVAIDEVLTL